MRDIAFDALQEAYLSGEEDADELVGLALEAVEELIESEAELTAMEGWLQSQRRELERAARS
eukprot:10796342-Lingulodinium_polyedra.AAC.1